MGNQFSRNPPEVKHELLNEHNERYFEKVERRNGFLPKKRRWRRKKRFKRRSDVAWDARGGETTDQLNTPSAEREEETTAAPTALSVDTYSSNLSPSSDRWRQAQEDERRRRQQLRRRRRASIEGWKVKRKGNNALQLRLAKNRSLQLATSKSTATSPITLDSGVCSSYGDAFEHTDPTFSREDLNMEFDTMLSNGMVWVEVARTAKVTAIAMSRSRCEDRKGPLLLAVGCVDGIVTITELLDEREQIYSGMNGDCSSIASSSVAASSIDSSSLRKFGETLEFPQEGRVRSLDFSPDGQFLAVGGDGCTAYILRIVLHPETEALSDLQVLRQVERIDRVYAVQFSPDSNMLAVGGFDGKVGIFRVASLVDGKATPVLVELCRPGLVLCLDWSPCGSYIAVGGSGKCCTVLDRSWKVVSETYRSTAIQSLKWNPDGSKLAIGDSDIIILETTSFSINCEIINSNDTNQGGGSGNSPKYRINSLCWSPDPDGGKYLAIGGTDGSCMVVETRGYALVHEVRRVGNVSCLSWGQFRLSNGDYRRYLGIGDETCNVALLKAGAETDGSVTESDDLSSAASSRASSYFSTESEWILREDSFRDVEETTPAPAYPGLKLPGNITSVAFSKASKSQNSLYLAFSADDCSLTIMTTDEWKAVFQMEFAKPIRTLAFSNSSSYLAVGGDEGVLYVLSIPSRSMIVNSIFSSMIKSLGFSKMDERLAVGSDDGVLTLLRPDANWEPDGEIEHSESAILAQDWSTKSLAVGREDGSVTVFETEKVYSNFFLPQAEIPFKNPVRSVCLGASGRYLAVAGDGGTLAIFSASDGWALCHQIRVGSTVSALGWCPSGRYIAFAAKNRMCRLIDTIAWADVPEARDAIVSMSGNGASSNDISTVDWSADGKLVAFGSREGGLHVLGTSDWKLLAPSPDNSSIAARGGPQDI